MTPERTCVGCRKIAHPSELYRIVRGRSGEFEVGLDLPGRGAWLCVRSKGCAEAALRKGALYRALRVGADDGARERLAQKLEHHGYDPPQEAGP